MTAAPAKAWFEPGLAPRRTMEGYWVPPKSLLPAVFTSDPTKQVTIGADARITADIRSAGRLTLSRRVHVGGAVHGDADVIVGPGCHIAGKLHSTARLVLQNSRVDGEVSAAGDIFLLGNCRVDIVRAGGDIVVAGKPTTGQLHPGGRISARAW